MIHRIEITPETKPLELKKLFRKKLMTGGAVIRLSDGLSENELESIFERFVPGAEAENINSMVLSEIARQPVISQQMRDALAALKLCNVDRALG